MKQFSLVTTGSGSRCTHQCSRQQEPGISFTRGDPAGARERGEHARYLWVYLGDLTGSGQRGRSMQDVENQVCSKGLSEVGLSHSSDEAVETLWSEGDNKLTFALDKAYRALEARRV